MWREPERPELTAKQMARAIPARVRKRLSLGQFESGEDVATLRRFVGLTQARFARAMGISVHTLRNWEQGRRRPDGLAIACCASPRGARGSSAKTWSRQPEPDAGWSGRPIAGPTTR